jgi:hypothetical protein
MGKRIPAPKLDVASEDEWLDGVARDDGFAECANLHYLKMRLPLPLLFLALFASTANGQIVVSPYGNDAAPGTIAEPFATPARAQMEVRKLRQESPGRGVVVLLRSGTYYLDEPLVFGPEDGGGDNCDVIWTALRNESVTFSGAVQVTEWTETTDGLLRAKLPDEFAGTTVHDLYRSNRRLPLARHPNEDWMRAKKAGEDRRTSFTFEAGLTDLVWQLDSEQQFGTGLQVHLLHDWSTSRIPVAAIDGAAGTLSTRTPLGCVAPHYAIDNFEPHPRFILEGHPSFLDAQGEWCQDPSTGDLLLKPPVVLPEEPTWKASADMVRLDLPRLERLIEIRGSEGNPVRNLHFLGISFQHTTFHPPQDGWAGAQASMHERRDGSDRNSERIFTPAAIQMEFAKDCSMERCSFSHLGGSGIWLGQGCVDVSMKLCSMHDIGANGINVGEDYARQVDGQSWWRSSDLSDPHLARRVAIEGCTISDVGARYGGGVGIWIGFAADCRIAFNSIQQTPYTGLSVGWVWGQDEAPSGGHQILNNDIGNVMQLLSDGGCIYTLGRQPGTVIKNNHLHGVPQHAGRAPSNGIFIDEGSCEILIEANRFDEIDQSPIRFHRAGKNRIVDNLLITASDKPYYYNNTKPEDQEYVGNIIQEQLTKEVLSIGARVGPHWYLWFREQEMKQR